MAYLWQREGLCSPHASPRHLPRHEPRVAAPRQEQVPGLPAPSHAQRRALVGSLLHRQGRGAPDVKDADASVHERRRQHLPLAPRAPAALAHPRAPAVQRRAHHRGALRREAGVPHPDATVGMAAGQYARTRPHHVHGSGGLAAVERGHGLVALRVPYLDAPVPRRRDNLALRGPQPSDALLVGPRDALGVPHLHSGRGRGPGGA
mmetsp:Transcript_12866/g.43514  ORF Transcript_12866/g.43514 Transcript_12866/m.43514 type:complete len:205 (-) Transcript_12866:797-1411(-)